MLLVNVGPVKVLCLGPVKVLWLTRTTPPRRHSLSPLRSASPPHYAARAQPHTALPRARPPRRSPPRPAPLRRNSGVFRINKTAAGIRLRSTAGHRTAAQCPLRAAKPALPHLSLPAPPAPSRLARTCQPPAERRPPSGTPRPPPHPPPCPPLFPSPEQWGCVKTQRN